MTATYDELEACNNALNRIGEDAVESVLNPQEDKEITCLRQYNSVSRSLLSHSWNWTMRDAQLVADADVTPLKKWDRAFVLPVDMYAGPTAVYFDNARRPSLQYEVRGNHLHCSADVVIIDYRGGALPVYWPGHFSDLFETALASRFAQIIREDKELADMLDRAAYGTPSENRRGGLFAVSKLIDAQSKPIKSIFQNGDPLTATRY